MFKKFISSLCNEGNPLYLFINIFGHLIGLIFFFYDSYFEIRSEFVHPLFHDFCVAILLTGLILSIVLCMYTDPGIITKDNVEDHISRYPYDNQLYYPTECRTCKMQKPARSKHDRYLNKCIARYDHYCTFLKAPIGLRNYRWFLLFLLSGGMIHIYGVLFHILLLTKRVTKQQIVSKLLNSLIESTTANRFLLIFKAMFPFTLTIFMVFLSSYLLVIYSWLLYSNFRQILQNRTGNDFDKYQRNKYDIEKFLEIKRLRKSLGIDQQYKPNPNFYRENLKEGFKHILFPDKYKPQLRNRNTNMSLQKKMK
ncbi:palmitoyltransferase swf1 [Anaeramoeba flamelloides]|uniref:Palmitoyltransferase n=1 Tax=Anaeramoeba flamelloides TaxID=1746091 RepID=A0AAV8A380_9EUKA|nr:palmitoyltransferase swf1 [Anaeramoeba flamelloides]KAJ6251442.1 palmitoyltransferase swf1 [Anaeramoeba flamelloides]